MTTTWRGLLPVCVLLGTFAIAQQHAAQQTPVSPQQAEHSSSMKASNPSLELPRSTLRVELAAGERREIRLPMINRSTEPLKISAVDSACRCIVAERYPGELSPGEQGELVLTVVGVQPGSKTLELVTSAGRFASTLQVIVDGQGRGSDMAAAAARRLKADPTLRAVAILHDLHGAVRGCGCTGSALGGLEKLPTLQALLPAGRTLWLATGDFSGKQPAEPLAALLELLQLHRVEPETSRTFEQLQIRVTAEPAAQLASHDLVITTAAERPRSARVIVPRLRHGMGIDLLLLNERGTVVEHLCIPLDESFTADAATAERLTMLGEPLREKLVHTGDSQACRACHPQAYDTWLGTAHARALDSLSQHDRATSCAACHTTLRDEGTRSAHVQCQACHTHSDAHLADSRQRTVLRDCLTCHDSRHHPDFDPSGAWRHTGCCPGSLTTVQPAHVHPSQPLPKGATP